MKPIFSSCPAQGLQRRPLYGGRGVPARQALTWEQVKARFESANPALKADAPGVDEMRAEEITACLQAEPSVHARRSSRRHSDRSS